MYSYIYLIYLREFIRTKEHIYKIGKTRQDTANRFKQYPKGSLPLLFKYCENCDTMETMLINVFKQKFKQRKDIGNEYFEGDPVSMQTEIESLINIDTINERSIDDSVSIQVKIESSINADTINTHSIDDSVSIQAKIESSINIDTINTRSIDDRNRDPITPPDNNSKRHNCNYCTNDGSNWTRHTKSKAHVKKVSNDANSIIKNIHIGYLSSAASVKSDGELDSGCKKKTKLECPHCNTTFKHKSGMSRHVNYRCTEKNKKQNAAIDKKDLLIGQLVKTIEQLAQTAKTSADVTNNSAIATKQMYQHF